MTGSAKTPNRRRTALVIVDMQNDFVSSAGAMARFGFDVSDVQAIVAALGRLLDAARQAGVPVFHTRMVNDARRNAPSWTAFWGDPILPIAFIRGPSTKPIVELEIFPSKLAASMSALKPTLSLLLSSSSPCFARTRFSPISGAISATVPRLTRSRKSSAKCGVPS